MKRGKLIGFFAILGILGLSAAGCAPKKEATEYLTVTFDTHGGSEVASQRVERGGKISKPDDPTKPGYSFDKWTYQGEEWSFIGYSVSEDMTLDANWLLNTYTITYVLNGGTNSPLNPTEYTAESGDLTLHDPTRFGYDFLGWEYNGAYIDHIDKTLYQNITLTAAWDISEGNEEIDDFEITIEGNDVVATRYKGNKHDVHIPKMVTKIGDKAFDYCYGLISITIPENVTSIGSNAFEGCYRLVEVINKSSLTLTPGSADNGYVAYYAKQVISDASASRLSEDEDGFLTYQGDVDRWLMNYAGDRSEVVVPDSITKISAFAFYQCSSIVSLIVPDSVVYIGKSAFSCCSSLESMTLPFVGESKNASEAAATTLFGHVFGGISFSGDYSVKQYYSSSKYAKYCFPESLKNVTIHGGDLLYGAFYGCTSMLSIVLSNGVTSIGGAAFQECRSLTSITIPTSVSSIEAYAFDKCLALPSIVIPEGVVHIGAYAFQNCESLASISISNSVTRIGSYAFRHCTSLLSLTIPESVTVIEETAFEGCYRLVEVINKSSLTLTPGSADNGYVAYYAKQVISDASDSRISTDADGFVTYEDEADRWLVKYAGDQTEVAIPNSIRKINRYAFYKCASIVSLSIPDTVDFVGEGAMNRCSSLVSIAIPNSVTSVEGYAFQECTSLVSATLPEGITAIKSYMFDGCLALSEVVIPDSVTSIDTYAFTRCKALASVSIPSKVTSIGEGAFFNAGLKSVVIGKGVTSISKSAFYGNSLASVFYEGTSAEWSSIYIATNNNPLTKAKKYYYSETEPSEVGDYWHYVNGIPVPWN